MADIAHLDANGALTVNAIVKFQRRFFAKDGTMYEPSRFGVFVTAGTVLPSSAKILEVVKPAPEVTEVTPIRPAAKP
jgi:hypothetical protein